MQGVLDPRFAFLHLHLGGGADLEHRHAAGQLGQTFLELFPVIVGLGFLDLAPDLGAAALDVFLLAGTIDEGGVVLGDLHLLGPAQVGQVGLIQLDAHFLGNHRGAGQNRQVFQHGLAPVAEARCLDRHTLEDPAQMIDHQGRQGLAFQVLGDDHQGLTGLGGTFQHPKNVAYVADFLVMQQDQRVV